MKKITKILSSVLAASMVISACAMNVFAASTAHTVTISADKTTALAAGDTVTVEVIMDNTLNLASVEYKLNYDTNIFTADTTKVPPIPTGVPNCVDSTWLTGIKDTSKNWAMFLGTPTFNVDTAGVMAFSWAGSYAIMDGYQETDKVIGKFKLKVKDGIANGTTGELSLIGNTMDGGENSTADMVCVPVTVTVGTPAPEKEDVVIATPAVQKSEEANGVYNAGFLADFTVDADANNPVKAVKFTVNNGSDNAETTVELGTTVEAGTVKVALNILNVTAGVELTTTVAPIAE